MMNALPPLGTPAKSTSSCLVALLLASVWTTRAAAQAPTDATGAPLLSVDGSNVTFGAPGTIPRRLRLPCSTVAHQEVTPADASHRTLLVACADRRLRLELEGDSLAITAEAALSATVAGSHEANGGVWLELSDGRALRLDAPFDAARTPAAPTAPVESASALAPSTRSASAPPAAGGERAHAVTAPVVGRVTSVDARGREFTIDRGSEDGLTPGGHVVVTTGRRGRGEPRTAVAVIRRTGPHESTAAMPYDEDIRPGQRVEHALFGARGTGTRIGEWPYRLSLRANLLPSLVLDNVGGTVAMNGEAVLHRGIAVVGLRVGDTGLSFAKHLTSEYGSYDEDTGADFGFGGGYAFAGVDLGFVAVATGVGLTRLYEEERTRYDYDTGMSTVTTPAHYRAALLFPLRLRVGREDSIHVEGTQLVGYERSRLRWFGFEGRVLVPAGPVWIFAEGSGGRMPAFHAAVGVRVPLRGNGGPGSMLLNVGAGVAGTTDRTSADSERLGPALTLGLERRY